MTKTKQSQKIKFLILVGLLKKTDYNAAVTETEGKIPSNSELATNTALSAIKSDLENKIPNISSLVNKKQIITQKLLKLKINLQIIFITNILLLQSLISLSRKFRCKIKTSKFSNKDRF